MKDQEETQMTEELEGADEERLDQVASLIQPLPENVIPSTEFLRRTRLRLLRLQDKRRRGDRQAA